MGCFVCTAEGTFQNQTPGATCKADASALSFLAAELGPWTVGLWDDSLALTYFLPFPQHR